jgi:hypothetical protein
MVKTLNLILAFCIMAAFPGVSVVAVFSQPGMLSARIGILIDSGDQLIRARGHERIKLGDRLRIYVQTEEASHVYVIHTDHKKVTLLGAFEGMSPSAQVVLPGLQEFYEVDGKSPIEAFTIICSSVKRDDISALFNSKVTYEKWAPIEEKLLEQGKIDLSQKPDKPSPIAGNVRELSGDKKDDSFIAGLPIYSGNTVLVKRYDFDIKK